MGLLDMVVTVKVFVVIRMGVVVRLILMGGNVADLDKISCLVVVELLLDA